MCMGVGGGGLEVTRELVNVILLILFLFLHYNQ